MYRRISIIFLSLCFLFSCFSTMVFASENEQTIGEDDIINAFNEQIDPSIVQQPEQQEPEQKVYYEATINDYFANDEILVVLSKEQSELKQEYTISDFPDISLESVYTLYDYYPEDQNNMVLSLVLSNEGKQNVLNTIDLLEQDERIISAEPNFEVEINTINANNSRTVSFLEDERIADLHSYACCARKYTDSNKNRTVKVGVVDAGVYNDISGVSDKVVEYVNCKYYRDLDGENDTYINVYETPYNYHGTNVAAVIAKDIDTTVFNHSLCGENVYAGVCQNVELYSIFAVYDSEWAEHIGHIINAFNYARSENIDILNMSFDVIYRYIDYNKNPKEHDVWSAAWETAIDNYPGIIITAAGNDGVNIEEYIDLKGEVGEDDLIKIGYPIVSNAYNVIVVGGCSYKASTEEMVVTTRSNYGQETVDLFATDTTYGYNKITGARETLMATSYAAPRVAGAAAVLLNINPDLTAAQIKHYIMAGVDKSTDLTNKCVSGGSLNIYRSAKMLIADMACEWQTVFAGHFTDLNNMQVAAYCKAGENTLKAYVWTYNSTTGKFSDPEHMFTNYYFGLSESYADNMRRSVAGDFDGNGYDEICTLYDWNDYLFIEGADFYCHPGNIGLPVENFTGRVVAGDFDNDGKDEVAGLYYVPNVNSQTKLYLWDFSGTKSGMTATQEMVYDSGVGVYGALVITDRVVAGDFTGDGKDDIAALYNYGGTSYTLSIFEFGDGYAGRYALVSNRTDFDVGKVTGRVVACNINDTGRDEIICMYDNSDAGWGSIINYGFVYSSDSGSWQVQQLYTSNANTYAAEYSTHLMVAGDFTKDGYGDIVTFYQDDVEGTNYLRGTMYLCEAKYTNNGSYAGYKNKWDSMD